MAFIDEIHLKIKAGDGGDGIVSWLHLKGKEFSGPAGGDGGDGGDVFVRGVKNLSKLSDYQHLPGMEAEDGGDGKSKSMHGKNGEDLVIDVPVGSIITNTDTGEEFEIIEVDQRELILKGGKGGLGNEHFKGSRNIRPKQSTKGTIGEEAVFKIELHLFADFGLVGFPNAGKSTLLNTLTKAKSKVGDYQFTTLEPSLGDMYGYIIADIPGLIEGASENKGLGHKFLRHIERTRILLHCIPADNPNYEKDYEIIRGELSKYSEKLKEKEEIIVITKTDTTENNKIKEIKEFFESKSKNVFAITVLDDDVVKGFRDSLVNIIRKN